jgi:hypothetical protein
MNGKADVEMLERSSRAPSAQTASEQKTQEMPPYTESNGAVVLVIQS